MDTRTNGRVQALFVAASLTFTALAVLGVVQSRKAGYTDALFEPNYVIAHAPEGGPLAEAGFQAGDSVVAVEGIPLVELGMYSRWPRSLSRGPGESLRMTALRQGQEVSGDVVFRERPAGAWKANFGAAVVLLSFLWFGVWALLSVGTEAARLLALLGLALSVEAAGGFQAGSWSGVVDHVKVACGVLGTLLLARFFLLFPAPKRRSSGRVATGLLFLPWLFLLGCLGVELAFHPRYYNSFGGVIGLEMLGYVLLALGAMIHTAVTLPRQERRDSGIGIILLGMGAAVALTLVAAVDFFFPALAIPGSGWLALGFALIPLSMALGVRKAALREVGSS